MTASGRKQTKRFLAITALGAIAYLALPMLLIRVGDAYIAKYEFGNAGNDAFERGILLTDLGRAFFAPVAWVADTGAPNWLLLLMIGIICLAAGAALATLACVVARSARAQ